MPLRADWTHLQAAITEYADAAESGDRNVIVLSLPVSGSTARASTAVAASLLRGLVNDFFETYEMPVYAQGVSISNTGPSQGLTGYSLAVFLEAQQPTGFVKFADEIRTAIEQALEDLPRTLERPDHDTATIIEALEAAKRLDAEVVE
jgi:hypothetical protein